MHAEQGRCDVHDVTTVFAGRDRALQDERVVASLGPHDERVITAVVERLCHASSVASSCARRAHAGSGMHGNGYSCIVQRLTHVSRKVVRVQQITLAQRAREVVDMQRANPEMLDLVA
jgi:hypothetical protein